MLVSEPAPSDQALPVAPLDEEWRDDVNMLPVRLRVTPDDPLLPFIEWLECPDGSHRVAHDRAKQVAGGVRTLLEHYPIGEVLGGDPADLAERLPWVAARKHVGGGRSQHGKPYRQAGKRFQEWDAVRRKG